MRITFEFGSDQGVSDLSTALVVRLFPSKLINGDLFEVNDTLVLIMVRKVDGDHSANDEVELDK